MKAKTMLGLIACASACVSLSAFGNETNGWFGVTVENSQIVPTSCATNGAAVTIENSKIKIDDTTLVITNFANALTSDGIVKISATALLTPNSTNDLYSSDAIESAKAGFAVGVDDNNVTNFYGYAGSSWHVLSGVTPGDGDTTFSMILNYRDGNVSFYVGDTLLTSADTLTLAGTGLNAIDASGSGSITSITGAYEVAVAQYGDKRYGSIAEAVKAAKADEQSADNVQVVDSNGTPKSTEAKAENGLKLVVCEAMGLPTDVKTDAATIKLEPATKSNANKITLAWDKPATAEDGVTIEFRVMKDGVQQGDPCDWDDIKIPMETGTYTVVPSIK